MTDISKIDKNFAIPSTIDKEDIVFYDVKQNDWCLYGVMYDQKEFFRMEKEVADEVSHGVKWLNLNTTGGRLRFVTDSEYIAISCKMDTVHHMNHMPLSGNAGFDIYVDEKFHRPLIPPADMQNGYNSIQSFNDRKLREITICMPLYNPLNELHLGLQKDAVFKPASPYTIQKPVIFYGSSITQGGCAARPGNQYTAILARKLDFDYRNLGFSGNAKAEDLMIDYLSKQEMSVFVMDYDHNAPNADHLRKTHEKLFLAVREKQPDLPIIMITKPNIALSLNYEDDAERREVIRQTYQNAIARGDKNVYFIDGESFWANEEDKGTCTVDGCHPNDHGFALMAKGIKPILEKALKSLKKEC